MTFDERLKEALKALVVYERPNETAYQQIENIRPLSLEEAIAAIKQAMRETMPEKEIPSGAKEHFDETSPFDGYGLGYNTAINEIEKGLGL